MSVIILSSDLNFVIEYFVIYIITIYIYIIIIIIVDVSPYHSN